MARNSEQKARRKARKKAKRLAKRLGHNATNQRSSTVERPAIDHRPPIVERLPVDNRPQSNGELPSIADWTMERPPPSLFDLERQIEANRDDLNELYHAVRRIDADLEYNLRSQIRHRIIEQRASRRNNQNNQNNQNQSSWSKCSIL